jgi:OOP family OmpA-OmpF porin
MSNIQTLKPLVATAALLACVASAHAEGFYAGGALGAPDYSSTINGYGTGDGGRGPAFKAYGGYQFNPNFAIEGNVFNLGRTAPDNGSAHVYGLGVDAVGILPVAPKWSLQGSLGVAQAHLSTPSGDDNSPALKAGVGVQYDLNSQLAVRVGYDRYHFTSAFDAKPNVGATFVGLKMNF